MPAEDYSELLEFYSLKETIGSGGFAKVKLGIHLLTREKVAIKIVDKNSIGKDLPRVLLEIEALKNLVHHNIARLIEVFDTPNKLFIVLEYCGGGELFDHIVNKDRLDEWEATFFFRQILCAVYYIHGRGYCHRDLKPENILLDADKTIKLIDFGLCAFPNPGLTTPLDTCCGSPAYAAPELISGKPYLGNEADIWSLGILLYALLCGFLPFEDDNVSRLYEKIKLGVYEEPEWLPMGARKLIKQCLTTDPKERITIEELITDRWLTRSHFGPIRNLLPTFSKYEFDEDVVGHMAQFFNVSRRDVKLKLSEWNYDRFLAIYQILVKRKQRREPLDGVLKKVRSVSNRVTNTTVPRSPSCGHYSTSNPGMESSALIDDVFEPVNVANSQLSDIATPVKNDRKALVDKTPIFNNSVHGSLRKNLKLATFKINKTPKHSKSEDPDTTIGMSPFCKEGITSRKASLDQSTFSPQRTHSCDVLDTPGRKRVVEFGGLRRPSSRLASIEDNIDKLVDLLTPKKRASLTSGPRHTRCFGNVALVENCPSAAVLLHEVHRVCKEDAMLDTKLKLYTVSCKALDQKSNTRLKFTLEVVVVSRLKQFGILRKRLVGDTWEYKTLTQRVLNSLKLSDD
ncbi:maternal embryonic leucine zipper kinase-like [Convolutriloba macropyga]|uniref:maternal embryonic leucine zipper kinase-like n=1 Tax=Convolutriloba macropyga TaxID=536237 RepID=UPI003F525868